MTGADISADSPEKPDALGRLEEIGGSLRDLRTKTLNTLNGVDLLGSLLQLLKDGHLTSEDLSAIRKIVEAHDKSTNRGSTQGSDSTNLPLTKLSLPPRLTRFEAWREEMKQLDALAKRHEGLLTSSRFIFSYPCVSVQAGPDSVQGSGSAKLRLSSVPIFDAMQSEDPISELFGKSPLNPERYKPRLDAGSFRAGILVPDYRYADLEVLKWDSVALKNGTSSGKLIIPENHLLLGTLEYDSEKQHYLLDSGDRKPYWINGGIPDHRIVRSDTIYWSAIESYLRSTFGRSPEENERNIEIERKYTGGPIILRQKSPEPLLPSPYQILAQCLDAIADTHLEGNGNIRRPRFPFSGRKTKKHDNLLQRPEVWQISSAIEQFRNDNKLEELFQVLAKGKTGHLLHEHLSLSTSIWLYRTVELMEERTRRTFSPFFYFAQDMEKIDRACPVSQYQKWQPFIGFYQLVAQIRVDGEYADENLRLNHARVALKNLTAAINDTL